MQILASHDRRHKTLHHPKQENGIPGHIAQNEVSQQSSESARASGRRSLRDFDKLKPAYHVPDAELVLDILNVRKKLNFKETAGEAYEPATKRTRRDEIRCFAYLAVWDNRPNFQFAEPIFKQPQQCTLYPYDSSLGSSAVNIEMDEPFRIKAKYLHVPLPKSDGSRVMEIGDKYSLEIKIIPQSSTSEWPPISILNKSDGSLNPDGTKRVFGSMEGYLVMNYANLPFAPADGVPLSVCFDQAGRTYKSKYGLEVKADWHAARSILEQHVQKEETEEPQTPWYQDGPTEDDGSKPKPKVKAVRKPLRATQGAGRVNSKAPRHNHMNDTVHVRPKTRIFYLYEPLLPRIKEIHKGFQSCRVDGYWCPSCRSEFQTLRQLHFHLTSNHSKFSFTVEKEEQTTDSNIPPKVTIRVEEAEIIRERASDHVKDPREMTWVAPKSPLDIDAYLNGDLRWLGGTVKRRKIGKATEKPKSANTSATPSFRRPWEVPDISVARRKRVPVPRPKVSGDMPFYRSISHQVVPEGESLSETDDEIDQSWLKQKHRARLTEQRAQWFENDTQRRLRILFDEHLIDERFPNTRYVSDAFVRFLRKMDTAEWFWEESGRVEIIKFCSEMCKDGVMHAQVFADIIRMISERGTRISKEASPCIDEALLTEADGENGNAKTLETMPKESVQFDSISPYRPILNPEIPGVCAICLKYITRKKQRVACCKPNCLHGLRTYHTFCVGALSPSREFDCPSCVAEAVRQKAALDSDGIYNGERQITTPSRLDTPPPHDQFVAHTPTMAREIVPPPKQSPMEALRSTKSPLVDRSVLLHDSHTELENESSPRGLTARKPFPHSKRCGLANGVVRDSTKANQMRPMSDLPDAKINPRSTVSSGPAIVDLTDDSLDEPRIVPRGDSELEELPTMPPSIAARLARDNNKNRNGHSGSPVRAPSFIKSTPGSTRHTPSNNAASPIDLSQPATNKPILSTQKSSTTGGTRSSPSTNGNTQVNGTHKRAPMIIQIDGSADSAEDGDLPVSQEAALPPWEGGKMFKIADLSPQRRSSRARRSTQSLMA